jgi:hypothetical protein
MDVFDSLNNNPENTITIKHTNKEAIKVNEIDFEEELSLKIKIKEIINDSKRVSKRGFDPLLNDNKERHNSVHQLSFANEGEEDDPLLVSNEEHKHNRRSEVIFELIDD